MPYKDPLQKKIYNTKYHQKWRVEHADSSRASSKKWKMSNIEKVKKNGKIWRENNKEVVRNLKRNWNRKQYHENLSFKISHLFRTRIREILKSIGADKKISITKSMRFLIGCDQDSLKLHIERQFQPGMTWKNHSSKGWHIDHIIPLSYFDFNDTKQIAQAFHYTNLQPLWAKDNLKKWKKVDETLLVNLINNK